MVLDHIPEGAGLVIEAGPTLNSQAFSHGNLDALHQIAVPEGLEDGVGEPKDQEILNGFLAQVMVDAVDLGFAEIPVDLLIEDDGGVQVSAERLFHHQPGPTRGLVETRFTQAGNHRQIRQGRQGQVKHPIAGQMVLCLQGPDASRQSLEVFGRPRPQPLKEETLVAPLGGRIAGGAAVARASRARARKPSSVRPVWRDTPRMIKGLILASAPRNLARAGRSLRRIRSLVAPRTTNR